MKKVARTGVVACPFHSRPISCRFLSTHQAEKAPASTTPTSTEPAKSKARSKVPIPWNKKLGITSPKLIARAQPENVRSQDPSSRMRSNHGISRPGGRHSAFRSTVLHRFNMLLGDMVVNKDDAAGQDEINRQAANFMNQIDHAFLLAERGIHQRNKNPLFWGLRDAFIAKDVRGLTKELQYHFQTCLVDARFSKGVEENQKQLLDCRFPFEWFPATRAMQRKIHIHVGPTNSGKTYNALKALEGSQRGVYAGPLRLLATEVYQRLTAKGLPCALLTGEEVRIPEDTDQYFTSCTVEMTPLNQVFDVAVIDEIQMIADESRGNAWTCALLGVQAKEVHVCGEERTVKILQKICASIGDECIIHRYERLSPLETMTEAIGIDRLEKGDAVVAFSRLSLHVLKRKIETRTGRRCAIIYGTLPPEVRVQQAALFNDPDNDYDFIVASDAIGMGLNLEIRRVVFESVTKFDGSTNRHLYFPEIKQIGGRAGRYRTARGANEGDQTSEAAEKVGYVSTLERPDLRSVQKAFVANVHDIEAAVIEPPAGLIEKYASYFSADTPLSFIFMRIKAAATVSELYRLHVDSSKLEVADIIQHLPLTIYDRLTLCNLPVSLRAERSVDVLRAFAGAIAEGRQGELLSFEVIPFEYLDEDFSAYATRGRQHEYLYKLESLHNAINQYAWLSYRYGAIFTSQSLAFHVRTLVEEKMMEVLEKLDFTETELERLRQKKRKKAELGKMKKQAMEEQGRDEVTETETETGTGENGQLVTAVDRSSGDEDAPPIDDGWVKANGEEPVVRV